MGLYQKIFGNRPKTKAAGYFKTLTAYSPVFTTWRGGIYEAELCRAAIEAGARQASKLTVRIDGAADPRLSRLMRVAPCAWMSWSQFFARIYSILYTDNTAFIVPVRDEYGETTGIYPIKPEWWELVESNGEPFVRFHFGSGDVGAVELQALGIMTRHQYKSDFFGETNDALTPTLDLISMQRQGIREGIRNGATYRFMARMKTMLNDDDLKKERERFNADSFSGDGGGTLLFPYDYEDIRQIDSKAYPISAAEMQLIKGNVQDYFNISEKVIQSAANDEELDGFFNANIEPFAIQCTDVINHMLYTLNERWRGNKVWVTANRLQYMSVSHKVQLAKELGDRGAILIDEIRELFNYAPLPEGRGQHAPIRGEYYFAGEIEGEEKDDE